MVHPTPPVDGPFSERARAFFASGVGRALRATLFGAVAFLVLSLVVRQARAAVHRIPTYRIDPTDVTFVDLPSFVDPRMRSGLKEALTDLWPEDSARLPSLYDVNLDRRLRELLGAHPMLRAIDEIDVRYPSEVRVRASVRLPLARFMSRLGNDSKGRPVVAELPVDVDGIVLSPDTYGPILHDRQFVLVTGVEAVCPGTGRRWSDRLEQVAEGLAAAQVANRLNDDVTIPGAPRIARVDVSAFPATPKNRGRGEVVFVLDDARRVQWGRTERDLTGVVREDGYDVKRDRLLDLLQARPSGDTRDLDVRFPPSSRAGS